MGRGVTGMIWVGPMFQNSGYGAISRNYLLGLACAGVPVRAVIFGVDDRRLLDPQTRTAVSRLLHTDLGRYPIGLINYVPDLYRRVWFSNVVKKIGYTLFETDRIPSEWVGLCDHVEEVWVPLRSNYRTFAASGVDPGKLRVFPYGVDTEFFRPISETLEIRGRRGFCSLYIFPFDWRKGFDLLLEASRREFHGQDDVTLVLKTQSEHHSAADLRRLILDGISEGAGACPG